MTDDPMTPDERLEAEAEDRRVMRFWVGIAIVLLTLLPLLLLGLVP